MQKVKNSSRVIVTLLAILFLVTAITVPVSAAEPQVRLIEEIEIVSLEELDEIIAARSGGSITCYSVTLWDIRYSDGYVYKSLGTWTFSSQFGSVSVPTNRSGDGLKVQITNSVRNVSGTSTYKGTIDGTQYWSTNVGNGYYTHTYEIRGTAHQTIFTVNNSVSAYWNFS